MAELVYALALEASPRKRLRVRVSLAAPRKNGSFILLFLLPFTWQAKAPSYTKRESLIWILYSSIDEILAFP